MSVYVRCKLCGTDHRYREDIERSVCDNCEAPLSKENVRYRAVMGSTRQADPLEEF